MSQPQPLSPPQPQPAWPQSGQNPFAEQGQSPFAPGGPPPGYYFPPPRPLEDEPGMRWILPVGQSGWAIAAGYFGLFSLICFPAPIAILLGLIAIWHLRKNPRLSGWGRAIFGLVMGLAMTALAIIGFVAAAISS